jgi:hypothetical protein
VSLEEPALHVKTTQSVDIPSGSTAFRIGAVPRFDVHFVIADKVQAEALLVSATALDAAGQLLSTLTRRVATAAVPRGPGPASPEPDVVGTSASGAVAIQATRRPPSVAIRGSVFAQEATRVLFTIQGLDGDVADSIAVGVPAMLADGRNLRPSWPMAVELAIPTDLASSALVIGAEVYGAEGVHIDGIRLRLGFEI